MRVKAKEIGDRKYVGYYNFVRRKPGDVFDLLDPSHFSERWMEKVEDTVTKTPVLGEPSVSDLVMDGHKVPDAVTSRQRGNPNWRKKEDANIT